MIHARIAPGCRRLTPAHIQVQAIAERFEGLPEDVSKGQALAAFKQAAQPLGLSPRLRDAVDVLFAFSGRRIGKPVPGRSFGLPTASSKPRSAWPGGRSRTSSMR